MAESLVSNKIKFPSTKSQIHFMCSVKHTLCLNWKQLASLINMHPRTIRDWGRGKHKMPYATAKMLSRKSNVPLPYNVKVIDWKKHLLKISRKGGRVRMEKYGKIALSENNRKKAWRYWWNTKGKFIHQNVLQERHIRIPRKNPTLAEFVGIMMGDGGITDYQVNITLHSSDDAEYVIFVSKLIEKLFGIIPSTYKRRKSLAVDIRVHRKKLVRFCSSLGLHVGDKLKQGLDIPKWIMSSKSYSTACLRGLIDTDGSVFTHTYRSKGKVYLYKKLSFTSMSYPLLKSVQILLAQLGIKSRITDNEKDVRIESTMDIKRYFCIVGTHNPKHLKRYKK